MFDFKRCLSKYRGWLLFGFSVLLASAAVAPSVAEVKADYYVGTNYINTTSGVLSLESTQGAYELYYGGFTDTDTDFGLDLSASSDVVHVFYINSASWQYVDTDNDARPDSFRIVRLNISYDSFPSRLFGTLPSVWSFALQSCDTTARPLAYTNIPSLFSGLGLSNRSGSNYVVTYMPYWNDNLSSLAYFGSSELISDIYTSYELPTRENYVWSSLARLFPLAPHYEYFAFSPSNLCKALENVVAPVAQAYVISLTQGEAYQNGYNDGKTAGIAIGKTEGYQQARDEFDGSTYIFSDILRAIVGVPSEVLNGLTPLAIWNVPIISIALTFMFIALIFFFVRTFKL